MIPLWIWLYFALVAGLYALIATLRYRAWRREVARFARRDALWRHTMPASYYDTRTPVIAPLPYLCTDVEELWD